MNLRQLEVLRAVMKRRTTTGAAHELGMSQPAVSNAIKNAEQQLGFQLFDRVANRLAPTQEAKTLYAESETLFRLYETLRHRTRQIAAGHTGKTTVLVTSELSESLLPGVMQRFLKRHPDVEITVDVLPLHGVLEGVETNYGDVGLVMAPHERPGLACEQLLAMPMVVACSSDHALAQRPFIEPADLKGEQLILAPTSGRINKMMEAAFSDAGVVFEPRIKIRFMNIAARCVANGTGVAIIDKLTASANAHDSVAFVPFRPAIDASIFSVVCRDRPPPRLARRLIGHAREELAAISRRFQPAVPSGDDVQPTESRAS